MWDNVALEERALSEMITGFIYGFYLDLPQLPHDLEPSFEEWHVYGFVVLLISLDISGKIYEIYLSLSLCLIYLNLKRKKEK